MNIEPKPGDRPDERIGDRVRRIRERAKLSQDQTADAMREAGYKWSNRTVWQVERGSRPLRLSEAEELTRILRQPGLRSVDQFLQTETFRSIADEVSRFHGAIKDLRYALTAAMGSGERLERRLISVQPRSEELDTRTRKEIERAKSALEDNHPVVVFQKWVEIQAGSHSKMDEALPRDLAKVIRRHRDSLVYLDPIEEAEIERLRHRLDRDDAEAD